MEKKRFFEKAWFIILMLVFVPPVGLLLIWLRKKSWNKIVKILLSVLFGFWTLVWGVMLFAPADEVTEEKSEDITIAEETGTVAHSNTEETIDMDELLSESAVAEIVIRETSLIAEEISTEEADVKLSTEEIIVSESVVEEVTTVEFTTQKETTTVEETTTVKPTTAKKVTTTVESTTKKVTTTAKPTTTKKVTTTAEPTTKKVTTTAKPTTTKKVTTTAEPTTKKVTNTAKETTRKVTTTKKNSDSIIVPDKAETQGNLVWVPTKGGTKYHSHSGCSNMKDPIQVSIETAKNNGYTACKKCY